MACAKKGESNMARTNSEISPAEVQTYAKFSAEHGIIHDGGEDDTKNADFILNYFVNTWKEDITEQNLNTAWDKIRPHLKLYSPAQFEYHKVVNQEGRDRANLLAAWLASNGGKPGQLVNADSDETYTNLRLLLSSLRGYDITPARIRDPESRIRYKPNKLSYVAAERRTEPVSPAA